MSERKIHQRIPSTTRQKIKIPNPSSSNYRRKNSIQRRSKPSKQIKILQRCKSEPILFGFIHGNETPNSEPGIQFLRRHTCYDVLGSPFTSPSCSNFEKYEKEAKVVVNVSVEGSPGPVRALVRLGASVEETIKLVVDKYSDEGRRPYLDQDASGTEFELHLSHFSLENIKKTEKIGEVGSRSFYLRKNNSNGSRSSTIDEENQERNDQKLVISASALEIVPLRSSTATDHHHHHHQVPPSIVFFQSFIARKMSKIGRRTRRLWNVLLGCG